LPFWDVLRLPVALDNNAVDAFLTELNSQSHSDGTAADDNDRFIAHWRSLGAFCGQDKANGAGSTFVWK
jgi:hypothetical protein